MTPTNALSFSHKKLVGPHHREITQWSLVCETPSVSRSSYDTESRASWELLVQSLQGISEPRETFAAY